MVFNNIVITIRTSQGRQRFNTIGTELLLTSIAISKLLCLSKAYVTFSGVFQFASGEEMYKGITCS